MHTETLNSPFGQLKSWTISILSLHDFLAMANAAGPLLLDLMGCIVPLLSEKNMKAPTNNKKIVICRSLETTFSKN